MFDRRHEITCDKGLSLTQHPKRYRLCPLALFAPTSKGLNSPSYPQFTISSLPAPAIISSPWHPLVRNVVPYKYRIQSLGSCFTQLHTDHVVVERV